MRTFGLKIVTALGLLIVLLACKKDEVSRRNGTANWAIDGQNITAYYSMNVQKSKNDINQTELTITGVSQKHGSVLIKLTPFTGVGSYLASGSAVTFNSVGIGLNSKQYSCHNSVPGVSITINITTLSNTQVIGNFSGTIRNDDDGSVVSTAGSFDGKL
jgi:hypothetical protein